MIKSSLCTAVRVAKSDNVLYTFVFSGKALERVMLRYVVIEDLPHMTNTVVDNYSELQKLYKENLDDMLRAVIESTIETYKPMEWSDNK